MHGVLYEQIILSGCELPLRESQVAEDLNVEEKQIAVLSSHTEIALAHVLIKSRSGAVWGWNPIRLNCSGCEVRESHRCASRIKSCHSVASALIFIDLHSII